MIQNQEFTYIGKTTKIEGIFKFLGQTHLHGQIQGKIIMETSSKIVLEIGSFTEGTMECFDLDIYGEFIGEIKSLGRVTIYPTALFEGKIVAKTLEIFPGAVVNMNGHAEGHNDNNSPNILDTP